MDKKLYKVNIAGLPLKLRSSHDPETVAALTQLVDDKIEEAQSLGNRVSFQNALLLASLHIAEELLTLKKSVNEDLNFLKSKSKSILSELESSPLTKIGLEE